MYTPVILLYIVRFLHQTTTVNEISNLFRKLYIVRFLHQTTTMFVRDFTTVKLYIVRFLHQTTTAECLKKNNLKLYIVRFLHQTTTTGKRKHYGVTLYIVRFLHQTTTFGDYTKRMMGCISSVSYIKPQLRRVTAYLYTVVYRPFPTSNHNYAFLLSPDTPVVYRPFPTSNHNRCYRCRNCGGLYIVRFLHQTTTSNHS